MVSFTKQRKKLWELPLKGTEGITKFLVVMDFAMIMLRDKRGRSETMSTNLSDKHDTIGPDMQVYQRLYWNNYLYILYNSNLERA
jgi:hypothetical protein